MDSLKKKKNTSLLISHIYICVSRYISVERSVYSTRNVILYKLNDRIGSTHDMTEYTHDRTRFTHDTIGLIYDRIGLTFA